MSTGATRGRAVALCLILVFILVFAGRTATATETGLLNSPADIAKHLIACWQPNRAGDEISVKMSFRRDGSIFGKPRITYMKSSGGPDGEAALATSLYRAIAACQPLRFTPALGAAIAGRTFLIRFKAPQREQRADLLKSRGVS